ncbi:MAG: zinc-binding dehydrogenase [Chloroflexi bacterium]|nr:zinc-binding dehydrogenase [Chloroflexota bacterium]
MLALRLHPDRRLRLHAEAVPVPGPGQALLRVSAVGLCGSDRHWMVDGGIGDAVLRSPLILGHEFAAVVESGLLAGRRVAVDPADTCGTCDLCRRNRSNLCQAIQFAGHGATDGALRELMAWPEDCLYPIGDSVGDAEAALIEPLAVAVHAADLGHLGQVGAGPVAVVGSGPIGVLLVALARLAGATTVIAADPLRHRLDMAAAFGATATIQEPADAVRSEAILAATGGRGCELVFEVAGESAAVEASIEAAAPGARVVLVGIPSDDRTTFTASVARRKGLTLKLVRRSTPDAFRRAVGLAESGALDLARLVTERVSLQDAPGAMDRFIARAGLKVIVEPGVPPSTAGR